MVLTGQNIIDMSVNTVKHWNGSDPSPAFEDSVFNTYNWNCAAAGLVRDLIVKLERLYDDWSLYQTDAKAVLAGDINFDESCWFDFAKNYAEWGLHMNGYDVVKFLVGDTTVVFFIGAEYTYMVEWYKRRGRTEWILKLEGTNMGSAVPVTAQEYAELLNCFVGEIHAEPLSDDYEIAYDFAWIDELEYQEHVRELERKNAN